MKTFALVAVGLLLAGQVALAGQETLWTGTRPNDYFDLLLLQGEHGALGRHRRLGRDRGSRGRRLRENEPCEIRSREEDRR
jgi:hypothetical protein